MSQAKGFSDVRQHARFELLEYAVIKDAETGNSTRSIVIDVSLGGLQVRSKQQFEPNANFLLNIGRGDSEPIAIEAESRYCVAIEGSDLFATGFRCTPSTSAQRMQWVEYVHAIFQMQGEHLVGG